MAERSYKRRKLLIDKSQYRLLIVYLIHFTAVLVIVFSAFVLFFTRQLENSSLTAFQRQEVASKIMWFYGNIWPFMWGVFMLLVVHSIYVTHKIAGPLYRIRNVMRTVGAGDLTRRVTIRNRDYLREDADVINESIDKIHRKIADLSAISQSIDATAADLGRVIDQGSPDETRQRFGELSDEIESLRETLGYFTVSAAKGKVGAEIPREATVDDLTPVA
jgi:methyl-accepting chemotaxis protein